MARAEDEVLYGGSAGGGKSDALVIEALRQVNIPTYKGLIIRKTFPQLSELIDKSLDYYTKIYPKAKYNSSNHTWKFPSGAKIIFGSMQHTKDKLQYQGKAYDFIAFDELTHFTWEEYSYLFSRNRPNGPGTRCYIRATANPGGIGHGWVKDRWITAAPPMTTIWDKVNIQYPDGHTEQQYKSRCFVNSSVFDNPALLRNDPSYIARLASLPEQEKQALLYGNWSSYEGQVFREFKDDPAHYEDRRWTHVINPFDIPPHWKIYRSLDWGYHRPFSVGWHAVSENNTIYRILEMYGCTDVPNTGVQWDVPTLMREIRKVESEHPYLKGKHIHGVADPAIWQNDGGPSIAEIGDKYGIYFNHGDNSRIAGWLQIHYRLAFDERGIPMMYIFKNCKALIRTLPALIFDETKVEDVDTSCEDHAPDEFRYMAMCRCVSPRITKQADEWSKDPRSMFLDIKKEDLGRSYEQEDYVKIIE